jgi:hypothetical protein
VRLHHLAFDPVSGGIVRFANIQVTSVTVRHRRRVVVMACLPRSVLVERTSDRPALFPGECGVEFGHREGLFDVLHEGRERLGRVRTILQRRAQDPHHLRHSCSVGVAVRARSEAEVDNGLGGGGKEARFTNVGGKG